MSRLLHQNQLGTSRPLLWLRAATADDQAVIRARVRAARLNPLHLAWRDFVVIEDAARGEIVAVGQLRPHSGGVLELASIAVAPAWQGQGLGAVIVSVLMARVAGPLYLFCRSEMAAYYTRFGFRAAAAAELPSRLAWQLRIGQAVLGAANWFMHQGVGKLLGHRNRRRRPLGVIAMLRTG